MELATVLARIDGGLRSHTRAPEGALDIGKAGRVGARGVIRSDGWIALEIDIEGRAEVSGITELLALDGIVGAESVKSHVAVGIASRCEVGEA